MAELIDKKSALNALSNASYGNFNYVTARNAIDCIRITTEAEIRAKAIDDFAKKMFDVAYEDYESDKLIIDYVDVVEIAEEMRCAE